MGDEERPTLVRERADGSLECVYADTQELVWVQKKGEKNRHRKEVMNPGGKTPLTRELGEKICDEVMAGATFKQAAARLKINVKEIYAWRRLYKWFREAMDQAVQDRAHSLHDEAIEEARKDHAKSEVPSAKLKVETLKWGAERGNPEAYAPRSQVTNKEERTLRLVVITGVPEPNEPKEVPSDVREGDRHRLPAPPAPGTDSSGDEAFQRFSFASEVREDHPVPEPHGGPGPQEPA
jgi:hypothetical protein